MATLRNVLAVVAGAIVTGLVVMGVQSLGHLFFPATSAMDPSNPEAMRAFVESLSAGALASVVLAWILGGFFGSLTAMKIAKSHHALIGWFVGGLALAMIGVTLWQIPHPAWMIAAGLVLPLLAVGVAVRWLEPRSPAAP